MAEAISWEIRETAYDAYVTDGLTYDQVAAMTGVSLSQVKRWGQDDGWGDARKEYRQALQSIRRDTVKLRAAKLKQALDSLDAQDIYAFAALERIEASRKTGTVPAFTPAPEKIREIKTPAEAVEALQEVIELKINKGLSNPEMLDKGWAADVEKSISLVTKMAKQYAVKESDDQKPKGFDADQVAIIRQLLEG